MDVPFAQYPTPRLTPEDVVGYLIPYREKGWEVFRGSAENQFIVDGLISNDPRYGGQGTKLVTDFIESVQVETGGFKPEYSALGGVFIAVVKSGSNELGADAWSTYSPSGLEAKAKSNQAGFRQPAPATRYDLGFYIGGPISKDRLFYYVGMDLDYQSGTPFSNNSGFMGGKQKPRTTQTVVKLNWFLTPEQQLTGTYFGTNRRDERPGAVPNGYGDADIGATKKYETNNFSLVYDWTLTSNVMLSLRAGTSHLEDTTLIISSDHGLWINDHSYLISEQEKYTPFILLGPKVQWARIAGPVSIMDINANISYLLGLRYNEHSMGRVFDFAVSRSENPARDFPAELVAAEGAA